MGGIAKLFDTFFNAIGLDLPPWAGPAMLLGAAILCWPLIRGNVKADNARKLLKRAAGERAAEREKLEAEALAEVGDQPDGLLVVAREAMEQGRSKLAEQAVKKLKATGKHVAEVRQLERALEPPLPSTPAEACIVIERMIATGMYEQARTRWAQARKKWPFDDELEALEPQLTPPVATPPVAVNE